MSLSHTWATRGTTPRTERPHCNMRRIRRLQRNRPRPFESHSTPVVQRNGASARAGYSCDIKGSRTAHLDSLYLTTSRAIASTPQRGAGRLLKKQLAWKRLRAALPSPSFCDGGVPEEAGMAERLELYRDAPPEIARHASRAMPPLVHMLGGTTLAGGAHEVEGRPGGGPKVRMRGRPRRVLVGFGPLQSSDTGENRCNRRARCGVRIPPALPVGMIHHIERRLHRAL